MVRETALRGARHADNNKADGCHHQNVGPCVCGSDLWPYVESIRFRADTDGARVLRHR